MEKEKEPKAISPISNGIDEFIRPIVSKEIERLRKDIVFTYMCNSYASTFTIGFLFGTFGIWIALSYIVIGGVRTIETIFFTVVCFLVCITLFIVGLNDMFLYNTIKKKIKTFFLNPSRNDLKQIREKNFLDGSALSKLGEMCELQEDRSTQKELLERHLSEDINKMDEFYFHSGFFSQKQEKLESFLRKQEEILAGVTNPDNKLHAQAGVQHIRRLIEENKLQESKAQELIETLKSSQSEVLHLFDQAVLNEEIYKEYSLTDKIGESLNRISDVVPDLQTKFKYFEESLQETLTFQSVLLEDKTLMLNPAKE